MIFDGLIGNAKKNYSSPSRNRWKYCVALASSGWKAIGCERAGEDIVIVWAKQGEENIEVRLSFAEQYLWLNYLEHQNNDE